MIVKILINGKEYGINVSENNYMGEVEVHDTFHCAAEEDGLDTIFGTNDQMITVKIGDDNMEEEHGCWDCSHFDGGNCIHSGSSHYGCEGNINAKDCSEWENAYITYHKDDGDAYTY